MTQNELKNIAPKLFEIQKLKRGFIIPKTYFISVEEQISTAIFLDALPHQNSFKVPKNYFDQVDESVLEIIKNENESIPENYFSTIEENVFEKLKKQPKVISIRQKILKLVAPIAVAASILAIVTFQFLNKNTTDQFASIKASEIEMWLNNDEIDFDTNELAYLYENTTIEGLNIYDIYDENEVFDYLNGVDVESLILTNE